MITFDIYWWVREMRADPGFAGFERYRSNHVSYTEMAGMHPPLEALESLAQIAEVVRAAGFVDVQVRRTTDLEQRLDEVMRQVPDELGGRFPIHLITSFAPVVG